MTEKRYIYSLTDPRTKKVFYVGQSKNPDVRLLDHIHKSHLLKTPKDVIITELIKIGQIPKVEILEEIEVDMANKQSIFSVSKREKYWINEIFGDGVLNIQKNNNGEPNETCLYCENRFHKKHKRGKFCSPKCKVYWHRMRIAADNLSKAFEEERENRNNQLVNAARGRDISGVNNDEVLKSGLKIKKYDYSSIPENTPYNKRKALMAKIREEQDKTK